MSQTCRLGMWLVLIAGLAGCGGEGNEAGEAAADRVPVRRAKAWIDPASGSSLKGTAIFVNETTVVALQLDLEGAGPGEHAVHLHEFGDCSAADASSAGDHWNPTHEAHGKWDTGSFHLGDIGNVSLDDTGQGSLTLTTDRWSMGTGQPNDIMGKAVVVHALPDDFTSQPAGAAGARIACGVIERE